MRRRRHGFTLLEVLIAAGIMGTALVAVAGAVTVSGRRVRAAREHARAARLLKARLAEVLLAKELEDEAGSGTFEEAPDVTWEVQVTDEPFVFGTLVVGKDTRVVTLRVAWNRGEKSLTMVSRRAKVPEVPK